MVLKPYWSIYTRWHSPAHVDYAWKECPKRSKNIIKWKVSIFCFETIPNLCDLALMWYPLPINLEVETTFSSGKWGRDHWFWSYLTDSQILLSSLRNCIFTDTCSILYFFDVLKSYDADSFISGNTVSTRDPRVSPYHRIQKMCVFKKCFIEKCVAFIIATIADNLKIK